MLAKIGQREIAIIVIVLTLIAAAGWYFTWYSNAQEEIKQIQADIDRLTLERNRGLAAKKALPQLEATIANYEGQIAEFLKALPPREKFANVLQDISDRAKAAGVTVKTIDRSPGQSKVENVRAINVSLTLESPFPELFVYLKKLENMKRFSTIDGLTMSLSQANSYNPLISTNLIMTVYVYEGTPPPVEGKEGGTGQ
ncbi:type 4a pilus biogenesis protein PilO [Oceanithermus sp.]